jgi:hypothetical protein
MTTIPLYSRLKLLSSGSGREVDFDRNNVGARSVLHRTANNLVARIVDLHKRSIGVRAKIVASGNAFAKQRFTAAAGKSDFDGIAGRSGVALSDTDAAIRICGADYDVFIIRADLNSHPFRDGAARDECQNPGFRRRSHF